MQSLVLEDASRLSAVANMTRRHVLRLAREGKLPCYRVGRQVRFHVPEVLEWMRKQAEENTAAHDR